MCAFPPIDIWKDWSFEESISEEEINADALLNLRVLAIIKASIQDQKIDPKN